MKKYKRILTEASGSLTSAYLISAIKSAGFYCVASDIDEFCHGRFLADDFLMMPKVNAPNYWEVVGENLVKSKIDIVLPSLDETLLGWSQRKKDFEGLGISILISDPDVVSTFQNKWETYLFFKGNGIPTPETSLTQSFELIKPIFGRGGKGIFINSESEIVDMTDHISQKIVSGTEFTVDILCDYDGSPIYIVPRKRLGVKDGKSTGGEVVKSDLIDFWVKKICDIKKFFGPVNMQCFVDKNENISFIEINPRVAGGMALGFAATENWISLTDSLLLKKSITPKKVNYGLRMQRFYSEVFF